MADRESDPSASATSSEAAGPSRADLSEDVLTTFLSSKSVRFEPWKNHA